MYGQQFVPNQMYVQPNMMPYAPQSLLPGAVQPGYNPQQQYRGGFQPTPMAPTAGLQQWQPQPPMGQQAPPQQQQQQQSQPHQQQAQQQHSGQPQPPHHHHNHIQIQAHHSNNTINNVNGSNQQQRQRNNEIGDVSRVIHLRNVTPEVTQLGIQNLASNFGNIKHIVMLRQMNQALVEMETAKSAQQLVDFFKEPGYAEVDGRRVYVRYSTHPNLTATQHVSRTLLVSMFNTQYDVSAAAQITPEIVHQIFASYGTVQRIVVLPKNESSQFNHNRVQALVQFDVKDIAEHVKNILQGQPVTLGDTVTFTLDIQFSRMEEIKTTNPLTSLEVDDGGNVHRPQPSPPTPTAAGNTNTTANYSNISGSQSQQQPQQQQQQPPLLPSNAMYSVPQQWA